MVIKLMKMDSSFEPMEYDGMGLGIYPSDYVSVREFSNGLHAPTDFLGLALYGAVDLIDDTNEQCFVGVLLIEEGIPLEKILQDRDLTEAERTSFLCKGSKLNIESRVLNRVYLDQSGPNALLLRDGQIYVSFCLITKWQIVLR
jgi:hypothetical protein